VVRNNVPLKTAMTHTPLATQRVPKSTGGVRPVFQCLPVCLALATWGASAHATVDVTLRLETSLGRNSNLFRADSVSRPTDAAGTETTGSQVGPNTTPITATGTRDMNATVGVSMPLGSDATRLTLTSRLGHLTYNDAPSVTHSPSDHTAQLVWRMSDLVGGSVALGRSRAAYVFDDTYANLDMVTRNWRSAVISLKATPSIEFPVQVGSSTYSHADQQVHGRLDTDQTSTTVSALYRSPTGNTAQAGVSRINTRYPGRLRHDATGALERDNDAFVELSWVHSVKTQASVRFTSRQRRFADSDLGSRHLMLYRMSLSHILSPMTRLEAQLWRQPIQTAEAATAYGVGRGMGLGITHTPSPRTLLSVQLQKESQTDELFPGVPLQAINNPETTRLALRTRYELTRGVNLFLEAAHEKRTRRVTQHASQNTWRVGLEYSYENLPGASQRTQPPNPPVQ
jgi:hypothetical protein